MTRDRCSMLVVRSMKFFYGRTTNNEPRISISPVSAEKTAICCQLEWYRELTLRLNQRRRVYLCAPRMAIN